VQLKAFCVSSQPPAPTNETTAASAAPMIMTENFFIMIRKLSMSLWRDRVEFARRYRLRQRLTLERLLRGFDREPRGDVLQPLETLAQVVLELPGIGGAQLEAQAV